MPNALVAAVAALLPMQRSAAFGLRRCATATTVPASRPSQYEPPFQQPSSCMRDSASRSGALCMASSGSDPADDGSGAALDDEDDLLASYRVRLDAEGGETSFRLRGDATQAIQEAREGGDKVLEGAKGVVDWDGTKAARAQVLPLLHGLPSPPALPSGAASAGHRACPLPGRAADPRTRGAGRSHS